MFPEAVQVRPGEVCTKSSLYLQLSFSLERQYLQGGFAFLDRYRDRDHHECVCGRHYAMQATNTIEEIKLFSIYSRAQATESEEKSLRLEAESESLRNRFGILAEIIFPYRLLRLSRSVNRTVERWTSAGNQLFNGALVQNAPLPEILDQLLVQYVNALKALDGVIAFMENEDRRSRWLESALARLKSRREELAATIDQIRAKYSLHDSLKRFMTVADVAQQKKLETI